VFTRQQRRKSGTRIESYSKTDAGFRDVNLDPALAFLLKNAHIARDSLHSLLKKMGRTSAGFHIFRRIREVVLQMSEARIPAHR
jgi:hypothetical protein